MIDVGKNALHFEACGVPLLLNSPPRSQQVVRVSMTLSKTLVIPPRSETEALANIPGAAAEGTWMVEQGEET